MLNWTGWKDQYGRKINITRCREYFVEEFKNGDIEACFKRGSIWVHLITSSDKAAVFEAIKADYRGKYGN